MTAKNFFFFIVKLLQYYLKSVYWQKSAENIIYLYILILKTFYFKKGLFWNTWRKCLRSKNKIWGRFKCIHFSDIFFSQNFCLSQPKTLSFCNECEEKSSFVNN